MANYIFLSLLSLNFTICPLGECTGIQNSSLKYWNLTPFDIIMASTVFTLRIVSGEPAVVAFPFSYLGVGWWAQSKAVYWMWSNGDNFHKKRVRGRWVISFRAGRVQGGDGYSVDREQGGDGYSVDQESRPKASEVTKLLVALEQDWRAWA